ncbi:MAG: ABC transporter permease [Puniceicoccales bacterium]
MIIGSAIIHGVREIGKHKFRSLLSMIGIILGVAALVAMVGVVEGMMASFRKAFEATGGIEKIEVTSSEPPVTQEAIAHRSPGITLNDYVALKASLPHANRIAAGKNVGWARTQSNSDRTHVRLEGVTPEKVEIDRYDLLPGSRFISDLDLAQKSRVVVLTNNRAAKLFDDPANAIGKTVAIKGVIFTVIGVTVDDDSGVWWRGRMAFIPVTTGIHYFSEPNDLRIDHLAVQAKAIEDIPNLTDDIERVLLQTHRGIEDFAAESRLKDLEEFKELERSFVFSLGGVAAITLLVGGIGIANVMLASISERIREIGIRKAVGARGTDIFIQFVAEALVISVIGGFLGIVASVGLVELLRDVMPEKGGEVALSAKAMGWGFMFSVVVGFLSGVFPALKAARLPVIDALRYE